MCSPKVLLISGGVGFVLSFLISGIAGVGFGTSLFRGFCFFLGFGGATFLGGIIISKFLPELLESSDATFTEDSTHGLDVTVGDDSSVGEARVDADSAESVFATSPQQNVLGASVTGATGATSVGSTTASNTSDGMSDISEDVISSAVANQNTSAGIVNMKASSESVGVGTSSVGNVATSASATASVGNSSGFKPGIPTKTVSPSDVKHGSSNLEELPDINGLDIGGVAFATTSDSSQTLSDVSSPISDIPLDVGKSTEDVKNMARAIQTLLNKD